MTNTLNRCGLCALIALPLGSAESQVIRDWRFSQSGFWSETSNWTPGDVPDTIIEIARLSPASAAGGGSSPQVSVDGIFEIKELNGNGSVDLFIEAGSELSINDGIITGTGDDPLQIILGPDIGIGEAILRLERNPRVAIVENTVITMGAGSGSESAILGGLVVGATSRVTGQGRINNVDNFGEIEVTQIGSGTGLLRCTQSLLNVGETIINESGELVFENSFLTQLGSLQNDGIMRVVDGSIYAGPIDGNGTIIFEQNCYLKDVELAGGTSVIQELLRVRVEGNTFMGNQMVLESTSELRFFETVFFQDSPASSNHTYDMTFNGAAARVTVPEGDSIILMPDYRVLGPGTFDANLVSYGSLDPNSPDGLFAPTFDTLEIQGEYMQTSAGSLQINIDPITNGVISDRLVVTEGDVELDGSLELRVNLVYDSPAPLDQIALANETVTLVLLRDPIGVRSITGTFDEVDVFLLDDRLSPIPELTYLDDRVLATFFCRGDVNRDGQITPTDFNAWINAYQLDSLLADMNNDGFLSPSDFNGWVDLYNQGCE